MRDFRDMIASMRAYNARKGFGDFGRESAQSDALGWPSCAGVSSPCVTPGGSAVTPRVSSATKTWCAPRTRRCLRLLASLGLRRRAGDSGPPHHRGPTGHPELRGHGTSASPHASIGRWRHDLPPEFLAAVEETFGDLLQEFGYTSGDD